MNYSIQPQPQALLERELQYDNGSYLNMRDAYTDTNVRQPYLVTSHIPYMTIQPLYLTSENVNLSKSLASQLSTNQRRKFTPEEDEKLTRIIAQHGAKKWDKVASFMPGRTGRQCRDRFHNYLKPSLTNGPWTREEDRMLEQKVLEYGQHWNKIVRFFKGRSDNNVKNRWHTYISRHRNLDKNNIQNFSEECSNNGQLKNINIKENDCDILPVNSKSAKRILFPPLCSPGDTAILQLNHGIFSFLNQV